jgi:hypothetical protein
VDAVAQVVAVDVVDRAVVVAAVLAVRGPAVAVGRAARAVDRAAVMAVAAVPIAAGRSRNASRAIWSRT